MQTQPNDTSDAMAKTIASVRRRFVAALEDRVLQLEHLKCQLACTDKRSASLKALQSEAHKIAGVAATIGFKEIGQRASEAENQIDLALARNLAENDMSETLAVIDNFLDALESALGSVEIQDSQMP
jgi:HPt (histidine-containing phosphotransfer) domain-containing protein